MQIFEKWPSYFSNNKLINSCGEFSNAMPFKVAQRMWWASILYICFFPCGFFTYHTQINLYLIIKQIITLDATQSFTLKRKRHKLPFTLSNKDIQDIHTSPKTWPVWPHMDSRIVDCLPLGVTHQCLVCISDWSIYSSLYFHVLHGDPDPQTRTPT